MRTLVRHIMVLSSTALMIATLLPTAGCATYGGVVRPTPRLDVLSPEAEKLTDADIESYLRVSIRPTFPTVVAVARLEPIQPYYWQKSNGSRLSIDPVHGDEADAWRRMASPGNDSRESPIRQVQFVNRLAVSGPLTIDNLRGAAAKLHAPLLLAYIQEDNWESGQNSAAMAYWTIVGLFFVPGTTVGHHSVCEGVLVDTRTGAIVATVAGEAKREENVLPGAASIARRRTREQSRAEAMHMFRTDFQRILSELVGRPVSAETVSDRTP